MKVHIGVHVPKSPNNCPTARVPPVIPTKIALFTWDFTSFRHFQVVRIGDIIFNNYYVFWSQEKFLARDILIISCFLTTLFIAHLYQYISKTILDEWLFKSKCEHQFLNSKITEQTMLCFCLFFLSLQISMIPFSLNIFQEQTSLLFLQFRI